MRSLSGFTLFLWCVELHVHAMQHFFWTSLNGNITEVDIFSRSVADDTNNRVCPRHLTGERKVSMPGILIHGAMIGRRRYHKRRMRTKLKLQMARDVPAAIDVRPLSVKSQVTNEELRKCVQELVGNAAFKNREAGVQVDLVNTNLGEIEYAANS